MPSATVIVCGVLGELISEGEALCESCPTPLAGSALSFARSAFAASRPVRVALAPCLRARRARMLVFHPRCGVLSLLKVLEVKNVKTRARVKGA